MTGKPFRTGAAGLVVAAALSAANAASYAQTVTAPVPAASQSAIPAPVILIVDMQQILREAKAAKAVQTVINDQYSSYSKEVAKQEDELQQGRAELERQRTVLAPDAWNLRARELQQRYDGLSQVFQGRRQGLQQSLNDAMGKVENAALEIIAERQMVHRVIGETAGIGPSIVVEGPRHGDAQRVELRIRFEIVLEIEHRDALAWQRRLIIARDQRFDLIATAERDQHDRGGKP